jgi:uncharacterized protein YkwD
MRLLVSLALSLILVAAGYLAIHRFFMRSAPDEAIEAPAEGTPPPARRDTTPKEAPGPPSAPAGAPPVASPPTPEASRVQNQWSAVEKRVLELTNAARASARLNPLEAEDVLRECAVSQSADMIERNFFDHVNPSGEDPSDRVARIHRRLVGTSGENIWMGTGTAYSRDPELAARIVDAWMHSPGHRANILRPEFTHLGVGVVVRGEEVRATQSFARVRAYLDEPVPQTAASGTRVDLETHGGQPDAEMYALQPVHDGGSAHPSPKPVAGASLTAKPGQYVIELYFRNRQEGYAVFFGPMVVVSAR